MSKKEGRDKEDKYLNFFVEHEQKRMETELKLTRECFKEESKKKTK